MNEAPGDLGGLILAIGRGRTMTKIAALFRSTKAATAVEYGLILAMIFLAAMGAISAVGESTISMWNNVSESATAVM